MHTSNRFSLDLIASWHPPSLLRLKFCAQSFDFVISLNQMEKKPSAVVCTQIAGTMCQLICAASFWADRILPSSLLFSALQWKASQSLRAKLQCQTARLKCFFQCLQKFYLLQCCQVLVLQLSLYLLNAISNKTDGCGCHVFIFFPKQPTQQEAFCKSSSSCFSRVAFATCRWTTGATNT